MITLVMKMMQQVPEAGNRRGGFRQIIIGSDQPVITRSMEGAHRLFEGVGPNEDI